MKSKKTYKSRKFGSFVVAGCKYKNDHMQITRLEWIKKYVTYGSKFALEREPDNKFDKHAIKVKHVLTSGKRMTIGYVPNSEKKLLANEWAPLIDAGWDPTIYFQVKFITEKDNETKGIKVGDCTGLMLRYPLR